MTAVTTQDPPKATIADSAIEEIRKERAVPADVLAEARARRDLVKAIAMRHDAARRVFDSGSIARYTANSPLGDADSGVILDRRRYAELGPDGEGAAPNSLMENFLEWILPRVRAEYPNATCELTRRALLFKFHDPLTFSHGEIVDPTVDLVIALDRRTKPGLWIPDRESFSWDPSDPEEHTRLFVETPQPLRTRRAHLLRLAKVAVKSDGDAKVMCSFNVEALGLSEIDDSPGGIAGSLERFLESAAASVSAGLTDDPARVSGPIKLPDGVTRSRAHDRLLQMAGVISNARLARSQPEARRALEPLFGPEIESIRKREERELGGALLSRNMGAVASSLGSLRAQKPMQSYGS